VTMTRDIADSKESGDAQDHREMRMLDPSLAGVMFTVDPGGKRNAVRLDALNVRGVDAVQAAGFVVVLPIVFASSVFVPVSPGSSES
jgi:hypothetical protein